MNNNLRQKYKETVVPMLMEQFKYKNIQEVPKITKITINQGLGDASKNNKALESSIREIANITGQKPVVTKARKSLAGFKIRGGMPVGLAVTLRRISDMLTRVRNANLARHKIVQIPSTKMTRSISSVLLEEGFIEQFEEIGDGINKQILLSLKYKGREGEPVITSLKRISRPGLRVYANRKELPRVLGGLGLAIISTSKGVLTDNKARHQGLGGEVLCYIW